MCPYSFFIFFGLLTPHTIIVLSLDPEAKYSLFDENTTLKTQEECPVKVFIRFPVDNIHTHIFLSQDPDARVSPLGENAPL